MIRYDPERALPPTGAPPDVPVEPPPAPPVAPVPRPRNEPALPRDPRVLIALAVVLSGFLGGLALLLFLIATDV